MQNLKTNPEWNTLNKMPKISLSKNALLILEQRYLKKNNKGKVIEKPEDLFRRVAKNIAQADAKYKSSKKQIKKTENEFYNLMASLARPEST